MSGETVFAGTCPLCHSPARHEFTGSDLLFGKPGNYDYGRCESCGAVFQTPMPDSRQIAALYPAEYEQYQPDRAKPPGNLEKGALRAVHGYDHIDVPVVYRLAGQLLGRTRYADEPPFRSDRQALDIGCGNGRFLGKLQALGWEAQGVEFNAGAVAVCHAGGLRVFHGDLHAARFADESFDMISARHLIEHLPDPGGLMAEVVRILKPGGYFLVRTPNSRALGRKTFGRYWYHNDVPRHLVLFSPANLTTLAQRHGLRKSRLKTLSAPKAVLNSIDYVTGNRMRASKRSSLRRLLARLLYVWPATLLRRGDEIFAIYEKPLTGDDGTQRRSHKE
jgi:SAM-dependent methyltransferase